MPKQKQVTPEIAAEKVKQLLVFNPKVEQVVRAIYFGFESERDSLRVGSMCGTALSFFHPDDYVPIGIADSKGYRLLPCSNSALISMGYHPTAVLLWLTQMSLNGKPVVSVDGDTLYAQHAAVANCARDVVFEYEKLQMVNRKPIVIARPILDNYRAHGKPSTFA